jgi:hypothetical protein
MKKLIKGKYKDQVVYVLSGTIYSSFPPMYKYYLDAEGKTFGGYVPCSQFKAGN